MLLAEALRSPEGETRVLVARPLAAAASEDTTERCDRRRCPAGVEGSELCSGPLEVQPHRGVRSGGARPRALTAARQVHLFYFFKNRTKNRHSKYLRRRSITVQSFM